MVDNVSGEDLNLLLLRKLLRIRHHSHIKSQNSSEFTLHLLIILISASFQHVFAVDRPNIHTLDRNLHLKQELKQRF